MKRSAIYFMILLAGSSAWAQETAPAVPPLPAGPLIKRAPEFSQWAATTIAQAASKGEEAPGGGAAKPKVLQRVQVTKTGPIRWLVTIEPTGNRLEAWCKGSLQIFMRPEWKEPMLSDASDRDNPMRLDFSKTDFPGFEWISASNYKGIRKVDGRERIVFAGKRGSSAKSVLTEGKQGRC